MKLTHAMLLAAGLGTRMRPLTETLPKPLIPVAGKPLIDWNLEWLSAAGITECVINSSYRAEQLEAHLTSRMHPRIHISRESSPPLETGGGILKALPLLGNAPFLALNSDAIFPSNYLLNDSKISHVRHCEQSEAIHLGHNKERWIAAASQETARNDDGESEALLSQMSVHPITRMEAAWEDDALDFLMLLVPRAKAHGWAGKGDFVTDSAGRIRRPQLGEEAEMIFTGVEIIHPRVFVDCPEGPFSLSLLWRRLEGEGGWLRRMRAVIHDGEWLNVGDLTGLAAAEAYFGPSAGNRT